MSSPSHTDWFATTAMSPAATNGAGNYIDGMRAIVTGAGGGIGAAVAERLSYLGASAVALVDLKEGALRRTAERVRACLRFDHRLRRCEPLAFAGDVTDAAFRRRVFDEMSAGGKPPAILVAAAGISHNCRSVRLDKDSGELSLYPEEEFRKVLEINLLAPLYWGMEMTGRIAAARRAAGKGRWTPQEPWEGVAIFLGSVIRWGNDGQMAYAASKGGSDSAVRTARIEWRFHGVRTHILHPGYAETPMVLGIKDKDVLTRIKEASLTGDLIDPDTVAKVACVAINTPELAAAIDVNNGWTPMCM